MKHFILSVVVLMITSTTTFSQKIGKAYIGLSLDETVEQCKSIGHVLIDRGDDYAKFVTTDNMKLVMFASPKSKTVWFGVLSFGEGSKSHIKETFLTTYKLVKEAYGEPYMKRRKVMRWDVGASYVYIEKTKINVKYTVINSAAFHKIESEY